AQIADAAREWERKQRDQSEYFRGAKLLAALDWTRVNEDRLRLAETEFLNASERAEHAAIEGMRRSNRRLRATSGGLFVVLIVAIVGASIAVVSSRRATHNALIATAQRLAAEATGS